LGSAALYFELEITFINKRRKPKLECYKSSRSLEIKQGGSRSNDTEQDGPAGAVTGSKSLERWSIVGACACLRILEERML
jgi:hypothetical protein